MSIDDKSQPASNLPTFAEALTAAQQMQQDWLEQGVAFIDLYVEDVDGDWLDQWDEDEHLKTDSSSASLR